MRRCLAVLALFLLPGCADQGDGAPAVPAPGATPMVAAASLATAWHPDAALLRAVGFEVGGGSARPVGFPDARYDPLFAADPRVGDGHAPAWLMQFRAGEALLTLVVRPDGNVTHRAEGFADTDLAPLPTGLAGITPALTQQLDDLAPGWNDGADGSGALAWELRVNGTATWALRGAVDADGQARDFAFDARTGQLLTPLRPRVESLQRVLAEGTGRLNTLEPAPASEAVHLPAGHPWLKATARLTGEAPGTLQASLVGPDGSAVPLVDGAATAAWPQSGAWTLRIEADAAVPLQEYEFRLCAPGDGPDQACPS